MKLGVGYKIALMFAIPMAGVLAFIWYLNNAMHTLDKYQALQAKETEISLLRDRVTADLNHTTMLYLLERATGKPEYIRTISAVSDDCVAALRNLAYICRDDRAMYSHVVRLLREYSGEALAYGVGTFGEHRRYGRGYGHGYGHGYGGHGWGRDDGNESESGGNHGLSYGPGMLGFGVNSGPTEHPKLADLSYGRFGQLFYRMIINRKDAFALDLFENPDQPNQTDLQAITVQKQIVDEVLISAGVSAVLCLLLVLFFRHSVSTKLNIVRKNIAELVNGTYNFRKSGNSDEIDDLNACVIESGKEMKIAEEAKAHAIELFAEELSRPLNELKKMLHEWCDRGFVSLSDKGRDRLDKAAIEVERLQMLVNELTKVQQSHVAGYDLQINEFDLSRVAANAASSLDEFAKSRSVEICSKLQKTVVIGDEQRIMQVVINLLSNAIKFSPPNGSILISTSQEQGQGRLSVVDDGPGIPENFRSKIFARFEQSANTAAGGSGLGLAISRELLEAQSGKLDFTSPIKAGRGSQFFFVLPNATVQRAADTMKVVGQPIALSQRKYRQTLWRKGALIISLPFLIHLIMCGGLYAALSSLYENMRLLTLSRLVADTQADVIEHVARGLTHALICNVHRLPDACDSAKKEQGALKYCIDRIEQLKELTPNVTSELNELQQMANHHIKLEQEIMDAPQNADAEPWFGKEHLHESEKVLITSNVVEKIERSKKDIYTRTAAQHQLRMVMNTTLLVSSILAVVICSALILLWIRAWTKRIKPLLNNVRCLAAGESLPYMAQGDDELAWLDGAVHDAYYKLAELKEFKTQMLSVTSHELRTPLTSISAMGEMAEAGMFGPLNEYGMQMSKLIRQRIADLTLMVTNLLDLEKMQSGKLLVQKGEINLGETMQSVVASVNDISSERGIYIAVSNSVSEIVGDRRRLSQALTALVRHLVQVLPKHSNVDLRCESDARVVDIMIAVPNDRAYMVEHAARGQLVNDLSRAIAEQHGGTFMISATRNVRRYIFHLPIGLPALNLA